MMAKRLLEFTAMAMIGDSVLCMVSPRRHVSLWNSGPKWWRRTCEPFAKHPDMTRALGAAGLAAGVLLAWSQEPSAPQNDNDHGGQWAERLVKAMQ